MKDYIKIGKIVNTHGIKGELKVVSHTDYLERFEEIDYLYTEKDDKKRNINSVRYAKGMAYLKLEGIEDMTEAETFKNTYVSIDEENVRELPEGRYYIYELEGMDVYLMNGEKLGVLTEVLQNTANDVYEVKDKKKKYYIPALKSVIKEVSVKENKMVIEPLKGLLD